MWWRDITLAVLIVTATMVLTYAPQPRVSAADAAVLVADTARGSHGSGAYLGDGLVLTAAHVARNEQAELTVRFSGSDEVLPAAVVWIDASLDLALLRIAAPEGAPYLSLACEEGALERATPATAAGYPLNFPIVVETAGIIGSVSAPSVGPWAFAFVFAAPGVVPGLSGAAIINSDTGRIVGIIVGVAGQPGVRGSLAIAAPVAPLCDKIVQA
ncbi:MAG: serine protease [Hyphomicrobiales bacterium]|nr:serine protease [Hyphomicrobiales bacterium]